MAATMFLLGLGLTAHARQVKALPPEAIRPPGALDESRFLGACLRCGLCVRACPYDTLSLAALGDRIALGTPYFTARDVPCEMCDDIPCVTACPSNALTKDLKNIDDARMGLAVLIDQENCLNFKGLRCDVCYRVCPRIDKAITLETEHNVRTGKHARFLPVVHSDACTGCGKCEKSCVLERAAIKVLPIAIARGSPDAHYRMGWEEKAKRTTPLLPDVIDLPDRLPEALR
jgi:ferredoxin-type protein NapG